MFTHHTYMHPHIHMQTLPCIKSCFPQTWSTFLASAVIYHTVDFVRVQDSFSFCRFLQLSFSESPPYWWWAHCDFPAVVQCYRRVKHLLRWGAVTFSLNASRQEHQSIFPESKNWFYIICILKTHKSSKNRNTTHVGFNNQDNQNPKWKKYFLFLRLKNFILDHFEKTPSKSGKAGL